MSIMDIKDIVSVSKNFVPAVKVEHHINDIEKLKSYIPTEKSIDIIRNFCINENGSNVIIGSYGSGKSHLVAFLANLMCGNYEIEDYRGLINKTRNIDEETAQLLEERIKRRGKRLVIIPSYNAEDFEQAVLIGISKALKREGYGYIPIQNSFVKAKEEIDNWENNFHATYDMFFNIIEKEYFIEKEKFKYGLERFNREYYKIFLNVYPRVTSGAQFFHFNEQNIAETIAQVNNEMRKCGYDGLDIIFDEFGSFLENNIDKVNMTLVQEVAELANNNENNISLYLITHKDLSQYGSRISDRIVTEWRKVEGRFRRFTLYQTPIDIYQIISNIIIKKENKFNSFYNYYKNKFSYMHDMTISIPTFKELSEKEIEEYLIKGCFPLAPLSVYALYKLADKVAQSNRTLFTFLISDEENSFGDFVENSKDEFWIGGDMIYDYFEKSIWGENKESTTYKVWKEVNKAINKVGNNEINIKLIKVIGLIYIINDFDKLKPSVEYISLLLPKYDTAMIEKGIKELIEKKVLFHRKIYDVYKFYEGSDLNIEEEIQKLIEDNRDNVDIVDVLNKYFLPPPLLPRRYNDEYFINRYFESCFLKAKCLDVEKIKDNLEESFKDGMVYYLIPDDEDIDRIINNTNKFKNLSNLIILLPRRSLNIDNLILKYWAIIRLMMDEKLLEKEAFLKKELMLYEEEISKEINSILSTTFNNEFKNVYVINKGKVLIEVNNRYSLQKEASKIMEGYFDKTPKINNEMINKNNLTATMKSVERKVINKLWESKYSNKKFKFKKFDAEYTTARTIYINTKILNNDENFIASTNYRNLPEENPIKAIFNEIEKFLEDCREKEKSFYDLYKVLKSQPYGLKNGVIPLLFGAAIIDNLDNIYIKRNETYEDIDGKLIVDMVYNPQKFLVSIDVWDEEKENYILGLEDVFKKYIDYEYRSKNRLAALYQGMKRYYRSLPKFTRETSNISEQTKKIRCIISNDYMDYKKLFFTIFPTDSSYELAVTNVKYAKNELDQFIENFKEQYSKKIISVFEGKENDLITSIESWYKKLDPEVKDHVFDLKTNLFVKYIEVPSKDYLEGLIKVLTGFDLEYLSDELADKLILDFQEIKEKLEKANNNKQDYKNKIDICINDIKKTKYLNNVELTDIGLLLEKKLIKDIENFNYAIGEEEKAYILMRILEKII